MKKWVVFLLTLSIVLVLGIGFALGIGLQRYRIWVFDSYSNGKFIPAHYEYVYLP